MHIATEDRSRVVLRVSAKESIKAAVSILTETGWLPQDICHCSAWHVKISQEHVTTRLTNRSSFLNFQPIKNMKTTT